MRRTFMIGTSSRWSTRVLMVGQRNPSTFPGPWRVKAVIRGDDVSGSVTLAGRNLDQARERASR